MDYVHHINKIIHYRSFSKVRDCSSIHKHEGTAAQIQVSFIDMRTILINSYYSLTQLKSDKEQKKLKYREAYLKLYYS